MQTNANLQALFTGIQQGHGAHKAHGHHGHHHHHKLHEQGAADDPSAIVGNPLAPNHNALSQFGIYATAQQFGGRAEGVGSRLCLTA